MIFDNAIGLRLLHSRAQADTPYLSKKTEPIYYKTCKISRLRFMSNVAYLIVTYSASVVGAIGWTKYGCNDFYFRSSSAYWIGKSPDGGELDATVFFFQPYAHFGSAVGLLGSALAADNFSGTLTPVKPLQTLVGKKYVVGFFQASTFSGPTLEVNAFVDVLWNGEIVTTIRPGFSDWAYYSVEVVGRGNDVLAFHGGTAPAWSFIDDITVFEKDIF